MIVYRRGVSNLHTFQKSTQYKLYRLLLTFYLKSNSLLTYLLNLRIVVSLLFYRIPEKWIRKS